MDITEHGQIDPNIVEYVFTLRDNGRVFIGVINQDHEAASANPDGWTWRLEDEGDIVVGEEANCSSILVAVGKMSAAVTAMAADDGPLTWFVAPIED